MKKWLFILAVAALGSPLWAQPIDSLAFHPSGRPKLGLSLSGGGARGLAHIGVLKVMEEVGLRPDYLTGTSMGSVVGGLYALGYPADSLESLVRSQDWDLLLSDNLPLRDVVFEEKPFFQNEFLELPIEGWQIRPPSGLIEGQQIMELLTRLSLPAYRIRDFADLPIPFQCMSADVVMGRNVPLTEGNLARSMRASMAIPTVFTAMTKDSLVLIDGGFIRNFAVEEVVGMGAQKVIGSYTGAFRKTPEKLLSFSQILGQLAFLQSIEDAQKQMPLLDVYIEPNLEGYSAADFNDYDAIMAAGEAAAREKIAELRAMARQLDALGQQPPLKQLPILDSVRIDAIQVVGNHLLSEQEIIKRTGIIPGDLVDVDDFTTIVESIYGTNLYDRVTYELLRQGSENILVIYGKEKLDRVLKTSLLYDTYTNAGLRFSLTLRSALLPADRMMFIVAATDNYRTRLNYLKYIGRNRQWFSEFDWRLNKDQVPSLNQGVEESRYRLVSNLFSLSMKKRLGSNSLIFAGGERERLRYRVVSGPDAQVINRVTALRTSFKAGFMHNSLDRNVFPTSGTKITVAGHFSPDNALDIRFGPPNADAEQLVDTTLAGMNYARLRIGVDAFLPVGERSSFRVSPFLASTFGLRPSITDFFLLGGPETVSQRAIPFYGLDPHELAIEGVLGLRAGYQSLVTERLLVHLDANVGFFSEPATLDDEPGSWLDECIAGAQIGIGYQSIVGPVRLHVMLPFDDLEATSNQVRTYLSLGFRF